MQKKDNFTAFCVKYTDTLFEVMILYSVVIAIATFGFTFFEGFPVLKSLWLSFVTATSTGYGDVSPKTFGGQLTAIFLMHATIFVIIPLAVARILSVVLENNNEFTHEEQEEIKQALNELTKSRQTANDGD